MKNSSPASIGFVIAVALAAFADGAAHSQQSQSFSRDSLKGLSIAVRGCVKPGLDKDSVVLDNVKEVGRDGVARPPVPAGLPTAVYAFNESTKVLPYMGRNVEVRGRIKDVEDSAIQVKPERDGALVAELPGSGDGVKAPLADVDVPVPVGTSGRPANVPAVVLRMHVEQVKAMPGRCQ